MSLLPPLLLLAVLLACVGRLLRLSVVGRLLLLFITACSLLDGGWLLEPAAPCWAGCVPRFDCCAATATVMLLLLRPRLLDFFLFFCFNLFHHFSPLMVSVTVIAHKCNTRDWLGLVRSPHA